MATLFQSLASATSAVELAAANEPDPRSHVLTANPLFPEDLILHAHRNCPRAGEELGYYTARQARRMLAGGDSVGACLCLATRPEIRLAA